MKEDMGFPFKRRTKANTVQNTIFVVFLIHHLLKGIERDPEQRRRCGISQIVARYR